MNPFLLFSACILSFSAFSQLSSREQVKAELTAWDAVRGQWLAESLEAMADNRPIPDRTFPEDYTPDEMYQLVPTDRQERIRKIASQPPVEDIKEVNQSSGSTNGITRVPVGGATSNNSVSSGNSNARYVEYLRQNNCGLVMGRSYGDPHIRTFDGKTYSFQTVGEYVISSSPDGLFEVQARQKPETNSVSLNTAVAMNVYGDRVGIYASDAPDQQIGTVVRVNGRTVYLNQETYYLPYGGTIENRGSEYIVTWPTGEKVQSKISSSSGMRFMNISVFVKECRGNYRGLMGNANGRSDDDFTGSNSRVNLASSTIFDPFDSRSFNRSTSAMEREHLAFLARDFGGQFLVNDRTSLFEYSFGRSSWTFYDPNFPRQHFTMADIAQADRVRARQECARQGILADEMNACIMDLAHANIQPIPRPSAPSRAQTDGGLRPVTSRVPNVNRGDVYTRPTGDRETGGVRTPTNNGTPPAGRIGQMGNDDEGVKPATRQPVVTGGDRNASDGVIQSRQPSMNGNESSGVETANPSRQPNSVNQGRGTAVSPNRTIERKPIESKPVEVSPTTVPATKSPSNVSGSGNGRSTVGSSSSLPASRERTSATGSSSVGSSRSSTATGSSSSSPAKSNAGASRSSGATSTGRTGR